MCLGLEFQVLPKKDALCLRFLHFDTGTQLAVGQSDRDISI